MFDVSSRLLYRWEDSNLWIQLRYVWPKAVYSLYGVWPLLYMVQLTEVTFRCVWVLDQLIWTTSSFKWPSKISHCKSDHEFKFAFSLRRLCKSITSPSMLFSWHWVKHQKKAELLHKVLKQATMPTTLIVRNINWSTNLFLLIDFRHAKGSNCK